MSKSSYQNFLYKQPSLNVDAVKQEFPSNETSNLYKRQYFENQYYYQYGKKEYSKTNKKKNLTFMALTLLIFMFFLQHLQQSLQNHMDSMKPQILVMQTRIKAAPKEGKSELGKQPVRSSENLENSKHFSHSTMNEDIFSSFIDFD